MPDISVVINTKDRAEGLRLCLGTLEAQTLDASRWEIIVVDDGSRDETTAKVVGCYRGRAACRLIRREHRGCAAARNTGIDAAGGRYVLFLGDDILAEPNLLVEHLTAHERWPRVAVVGPYEWDREVSSKVFLQYAETRRFRNIRNSQNASWRFFYTGNASVERQTLLDVGGFDENFFRYAWEDMDLGVRLGRAGVRIVYYPRAHAVHHHPYVSLESLCRAEFEQSFSAWYFFNKWKNDPSVQCDRFWPRDPASVAVGPPWRKTLGRAMIHAAEQLCPIPALLRVLYERLVWSCRYEGLRAGAAYYGPILERWRAGDRTGLDSSRQFQM
jgi:GT2 family glycosyltransferase